MNMNEIRALAELMVECGLESLKIEDGDYQVSMTRAGTVSVQPAVVAAPAPVAAPVAVAAAAEPAPALALKTINSPIVGVYYQSSSPDAEPYVKVGQRVSKGDVLCIVEAMKMMNEITSDYDGEITEILVRDGQVVEYGQALFALKDEGDGQ